MTHADWCIWEMHAKIQPESLKKKQAACRWNIYHKEVSPRRPPFSAFPIGKCISHCPISVFASIQQQGKYSWSSTPVCRSAPCISELRKQRLASLCKHTPRHSEWQSRPWYCIDIRSTLLCRLPELQISAPCIREIRQEKPKEQGFRLYFPLSICRCGDVTKCNLHFFPQGK